jgi:dienelactone hydrolase
MPRLVVLPLLLALVGVAAPQAQESVRPRYRTLDDRLVPRQYATLADWQRRADYLRQHVLASAGLVPAPEKTPLRAQIFDEKPRPDYSVFKVYFESLPGFYVTGNLYRPKGDGPFPAILTPHGHWPYGRFENTELNSVPARAINLARQGFVVFTYDMIGYNDSRQLTHEFGGKRETLWGLSLAGLQLWNSIRALDFLESLPQVDRDRIGVTGESGGGTQTFLLAAVDTRVKVAAPVNMISLHMQGGCLCENEPGLRLDTNNVELGALMAPRPLLMVAATGDWTNETPAVEYPAMRRIYQLFAAEDHVYSEQFDAPHNYNQNSREAVYAWMARWLKNAPADVRIAERPFTVERLTDLLVFAGRPLPDGALTAAQITDQWIASARRQLTDTEPRVLQSALRHSLSFDRQSPKSAPTTKSIVSVGMDASTDAALARAGFTVHHVDATPFDADAAARIAHFDTYNRSAASQRVADIVRAVDEHPGAAVVAGADWGLAALVAAAVAPASRVVADVAQFDISSDDAFIERLYIPGLRRAGDLRTAMTMTAARVVAHNAGDRFTLEHARVERDKLSADRIVELLR